MDFDPRWPGVLDALLADAARAATIGPDDLGELYLPPADLGPLPMSLKSRAVEVLQVVQASAMSLQTQVDAVRVEIARLARSERVGTITRERRGAFEVLA